MPEEEDDGQGKKPERLTKEEVEEMEAMEGKGGKQRGLSGLWQLLLPLVISLAVCYLMIGGIGVSKNDFTVNLTNMAETIAGIQTSLNTMQVDIKSLKDSYPTLSSQVTSLSQNTANVSSLQSSLSTLQTTLNTVKSDLANAVSKEATDISNLRSSVDSLKALVVALETEVDNLTSGSSGGSSGTTATGVAACRSVGGRLGHPRQALDPRAGSRVFGGERRRLDARGRALCRLAGPGHGLQDRHDQDPGAAPASDG